MGGHFKSLAAGMAIRNISSGFTDLDLGFKSPLSHFLAIGRGMDLPARPQFPHL